MPKAASLKSSARVNPEYRFPEKPNEQESDSLPAGAARRGFLRRNGAERPSGDGQKGENAIRI